MRRFVACVAVCLMASVAGAGVPGDVNGDGIANAADVACAIEVAFDPDASCAAVQAEYVRTIVVSPVVGDSLASGIRLLDAVDAITGAAWNNPYLVKIEPGHYELPANRTLQMKPFVDIEGSGMNSTFIVRSGGAVIGGTVTGSDDAGLKNLTVFSSGGAYAVALYNYGARPNLSDLTLYSMYGTSQSIGMYNLTSFPQTSNVSVTASDSPMAIGIYNDDSSLSLRGIKVQAAMGSTYSIAVYNDNGSHPVIEESMLAVSGPGDGRVVLNTADSAVDLVRVTALAAMVGNGVGVYITSGTSPRSMRILNSNVSGGTAAITGGDANLTISVGASQLGGGITSPGSTVYRCAFAFDGDFQPLNATCQ